ncbi:hypothetical protein HPY86_04000 [candidate division WOR-3 bacterium]|nr:hypothetical protein [candidate division WOR-3 bacterium]
MLILLSTVCLFFAFSGPGLLPVSGQVTVPLFVESPLVRTGAQLSSPVLIDSSVLAAFGAALDAHKRLWAAVSTPDGKLTLYRSQTPGNLWEDVLTINLGQPARLIELIAPAVPAPLFIFYLTAENHGDLYLLRFDPVTLDTQKIPLAVGPDTVDDFSVTVDPDSNYYLYLLYVNEHRTGLNGYFTRSLDGGRNWEGRQPFWNCFDPALSFGTGSLLHCIWRYAITGREIHYAANRYYGAASRWSGLYTLKSGSERCFDPVIAQAPVIPYWRAPVWAFWTVARRDTAMLDIEYTLSTDGGRSWGTTGNLGAMFVDEWFPDLTTATGSAELCYNAGARTENAATVLYWQTSRSYAPQLWSAPVRVNAPRLNCRVEGARPRLIPLSWNKPCLPGVFFSLYDSVGARGLYFSPVLGKNEPGPLPAPAVLHQVIEPGTDLFDVTGRKVRSPHFPNRQGIFFQRSGTTLKKIVRLR